MDRIAEIDLSQESSEALRPLRFDEALEEFLQEKERDKQGYLWQPLMAKARELMRVLDSKVTYPHEAQYISLILEGIYLHFRLKNRYSPNRLEEMPLVLGDGLGLNEAYSLARQFIIDIHKEEERRRAASGRTQGKTTTGIGKAILLIDGVARKTYPASRLKALKVMQ